MITLERWGKVSMEEEGILSDKYGVLTPAIGGKYDVNIYIRPSWRGR